VLSRTKNLHFAKATFPGFSALEELTPQIVKEMVQQIIREHLGWLVVWGGFFGGMMGAAFYFV
jgi:hypothetical protein